MTRISNIRHLVSLVAVSAAVLFSFMPARAQTVPPIGPIQLTLDASRFRGPDDSTASLEVYYAFSESALQYLPDSAGYKGMADLTLVLSEGDTVVHADRWLVPHAVRDTAQLRRNLSLTGVYAVGLRRGDYVLKVLLRDQGDLTRKDSVVLRVPIRPVGSTGVVMSDLEFASVIRQGKKGSPFYKNTLDVIPNASGLYGEGQNCYYYAEAYNLQSGDDKSDYSIRTIVFNAVGKEVMSRDRSRKRQAESTVIVDNFDVSTMKSGTYTLSLAIVDSANKTQGMTAKRFYVYNPTMGVDSAMLQTAANLPMAAFAGMSEAELDQEFSMARYEATGDEKSQYESIEGVDAKRKFLSDFWRRRPLGVREEYLARAEYTNANFRMMGRQGFRTDRGRVYITYGPPDDYERHPNEPESRPYEIWSYNSIQGGVYFVFIQRNPGGDYELVHSTHRNELQNENWQEQATAR